MKGILRKYMIMFFAEVMFPPFDREVWVNTINYCDE